MKKNVVVIFLCIFLNSILLNCYLGATDELWVYANTYKTAIGYHMYKDLNIIQTPITFLLGSGILHIFGKNFFVFRLYGVMMNSCFMLAIYGLLRKCHINKRNAILYLIMIWGMLMEVLANGASYNILVYIFVLVGIIVEIKYQLLRGNKWWIQTMLAGLIFFTKQNVGMYYLIGICILDFMWNGRGKRMIQHLGIFTLLLSGIFLIFNYIGIWDEFISYTVLGLREFKDKNFHLDATLIAINIVIPIASSLLYFYLKQKKHRKDSTLDILYAMGMLMLLFAYPLSNTYHILLSVVIILLFAIYIIEVVFFQGCLNDPKYTRIMDIVIVILILPIICYSILSIYNCYISMEKDDWNNPYFGAIFEEDTKEEIKTITDYMKEKEKQGITVYVFSNKASLFNIPLGICHGAMDLPMTGNFGKDGEEGMIREIQALRNGEILIDKEYDSDYQKPLKVRQWIENNLDKKGEIGNFLIYDTKKE